MATAGKIDKTIFHSTRSALQPGAGPAVCNSLARKLQRTGAEPIVVFTGPGRPGVGPENGDKEWQAPIIRTYPAG